MWPLHHRSHEFGPSSELIAAIFRNITRTTGGRRFAQLRMDDSGRWRVVHVDRAPQTFPSYVAS